MEIAHSPTKILWVDVECSGLEVLDDVILEVGIRITNIEGEGLDRWTSLVWNPEWEEKTRRNSFVWDMHLNSGLVKELLELDASISRFEMYPKQIAHRGRAWLESRLGADAATTLPMAGNSVHYDRSFLMHHMLELGTFWHYRNLDVSSMREAMRLRNRTLFNQLPAPVKAHRPQQDLDESVKLWRWLGDNFFWI